eukprot:15149717-Alexandrium_andersonii.AAC.1
MSSRSRPIRSRTVGVRKGLPPGSPGAKRPLAGGRAGPMPGSRDPMAGRPASSTLGLPPPRGLRG